MDCMLHIGTKVTRDGGRQLEALIRGVLKAGFDFRTSDAVMIKALELCQTAHKVENVTVTNSVFSGSASSKKK